MKTKIIPIIFAFILISLPGFSQELAFSKRVNIPPTDKGPNTFSYGHIIFGANNKFQTESNDQFISLPVLSHEVYFGYLHKIKINEYFSCGTALQFSREQVWFKQYEGKTFPDESLFENEALTTINAQTDVFFRINSSKRGNYMGRFLDIGMFIQLPILKKYIKYEITDNTNQNTLIRTSSEPDYFTSQNFGIIGKIGYNQYTLYIKYRLSKLLNEEYLFDLPKFSAGLIFGIHP